MEDYQEVVRHIDKLDSMVPSGLLAGDDWDFKGLWGQIRATGGAFKGVRFPSREEHQQAWERFQVLVEKIKKKENERRGFFDQKKAKSAEIRDDLVRRAEGALPDESGLSEFILTVATGGLYLLAKQALEALLGQFDERREELSAASRRLRETWQKFSEQKASLLKNDKDTVFHALKNAQSRLDILWAQYKAERQKTLDAHFQEKRRKHEAWRERTLENVQKNQERRSRLEGVLSHKRGHLGSLYDRLSDARSEEYRSRVEGWIDEERSAISDIENKIDQMDRWISEDLAKLNQ